MSNILPFLHSNWLNITALAWFLFCFNGYMFYSKKHSYDHPCLASLLHSYRHQWMLRMLTREMRIADNAAIANLEKSVAFFASTTMLILAGLMTILGSTEKAIGLMDGFPFSVTASRTEWEVKIVVLIIVFVYAFFKFTWSLRQYGFVTIMVGAAPVESEQVAENELDSELNKKREALVKRIASMTSMAANNFNIGLRTYYYSIAILTWFINPWIFMASTAGIVFILYRREFKSSTLKILMMDDFTVPKAKNKN
jgi:uncharacterized membrane protein